MTFATKSVALCLAQLVILSSTGGKMLYDRATLPRVWVKTVPIDPTLPIRGRYVQLTLEVDDPYFVTQGPAELEIEHGQLVAHRPHGNTSNYIIFAGGTARLAQPVVFFLSDNLPDPSRQAPGDELWVQVSVSPTSHPRPVRLGTKHNGVLTPLKVE